MAVGEPPCLKPCAPRNQSLLMALRHSFLRLSKGLSSNESLCTLRSPGLWLLPRNSRSLLSTRNVPFRRHFSHMTFHFFQGRSA